MIFFSRWMLILNQLISSRKIKGNMLNGYLESNTYKKLKMCLVWTLFVHLAFPPHIYWLLSVVCSFFWLHGIPINIWRWNFGHLVIFNVLSARINAQMSLLGLFFGFLFSLYFFSFYLSVSCRAMFLSAEACHAHDMYMWSKRNNFRSYYPQQWKCPSADRCSWCGLVCITIPSQYVPAHNISGNPFLCILLLIMKNQQESERCL